MNKLILQLAISMVIFSGVQNICAQQWNWATIAGGGTSGDICNGIAYDSQGNVYWVGSVNGNVNFSGQIFSTQRPWGTLAKYDVAGNLLWVKTISSNVLGNVISANGIAIDRNDRIYICGSFIEDATFSPNINLNSPGNLSDIFLASYDTSGNPLWARRQGGTGSDNGTSVTVDENGRVYLMSRLSNNLTWFKYDSLGNMIFSFSPNITGPTGPTNYINPKDITCKDGRLFYSGTLSYRQADFGNGIFVGSVSRVDAFAVCSDTLGNLIWARSFASSNSALFSNAVDDDLNSLFVGYYSNYLVVDGDTLFENGINTDAIMISLDVAGNTIFKKTINGAGRDQIRGARKGPFNTWYIGGEFKSQNSTTSVDILGIPLISLQTDVFLARINAAGLAEWVRKGDSNGEDYSNAMEFDTINNKLYIGGLTTGLSTWGSSTINSAGLSDALMAQLNDTTAFIIPPNLPQVSITTIDATCYDACNGEASINITGGYPPYWIILDTVLISGNTIPNLCVGNYQLLVTDSAGQTANASFSIAQPDSLYLTWTIDLICNPVHYYIEAYAFGGVPPYQFLWPDGSQDYFYFPSAIDTDYVELNVTDANGCGVMLSESLLPYVPLVVNLQQSFDTIYFHETLTSFQWFFDGVAQASTDTFLVILSDGNYWLEFTDTYGCPGVSDTIFIDISTGVDEKVNDNFTMHPNPSQGLFQLIPDQKESPYSVQIFDSKGQLMMERACINAVNFDLGAWPNGVYILRISNVNQAPRHLQFIKY